MVGNIPPRFILLITHINLGTFYPRNILMYLEVVYPLGIPPCLRSAWLNDLALTCLRIQMIHFCTSYDQLDINYDMKDKRVCLLGLSSLPEAENFDTFLCFFLDYA